MEITSSYLTPDLSQQAKNIRSALDQRKDSLQGLSTIAEGILSEFGNKMKSVSQISTVDIDLYIFPQRICHSDVASLAPYFKKEGLLLEALGTAQGEQQDNCCSGQLCVRVSILDMQDIPNSKPPTTTTSEWDESIADWEPLNDELLKEWFPTSTVSRAEESMMKANNLVSSMLGTDHATQSPSSIGPRVNNQEPFPQMGRASGVHASNAMALQECGGKGPDLVSKAVLSAAYLILSGMKKECRDKIASRIKAILKSVSSASQKNKINKYIETDATPIEDCSEQEIRILRKIFLSAGFTLTVSGNKELSKKNKTSPSSLETSQMPKRQKLKENDKEAAQNHVQKVIFTNSSSTISNEFPPPKLKELTWSAEIFD
jgi:hypothetical protein